jgi:hypothetical protein
MPIFFKYFLAWFPMLTIAIANGSLRNLWYRRYMSDNAAHQVSTFTLIIFFALYVWYIVGRIPLSSGAQALLAGLLWLVLTLVFEFGFGRWRGNSWDYLLADYNLAKGRLWVLIPIFTAIAPYIFYKIRR